MKVLVTGASGTLGSNLLQDWVERYELVGVFHRHPISLPGVRTLGADLSQPGEAERLLRDVRPDWVVHCAAATDLDACERDPDWARRLNVEMAGRVAAAAHAIGARLTHISTDGVFDGERGGYQESDLPEPINVYGHSKLAGEAAVMRVHPQALAVRTNLFGWSSAGRNSLVEWFLGRLESGEASPGFEDVWFSPISVHDLGQALDELQERRAAGVLHVGGATCLTKLEFGRRLAKLFGFDPRQVVAASWRSADLQARRGSRLCLDSSAAQAVLDRPLPTVEAGLQRLYATRQRRRIRQAQGAQDA